jgi:hypothetical protein
MLRIFISIKTKPVGEICKLNQGLPELHGIGMAAIKKFRSGVHLIYSLTAFDQRCDSQLTSKFVKAKNPGEKSSRNRLRGGFQGAHGDGTQNNYRR